MRVGTIFNTQETIEGLYRKKGSTFLKQAEKFAKAGAEHIELTADHFSIVENKDYLKSEIRKLLHLKEEGITFSVHAPCVGGVSTGSNHPFIRQASVAAIIDAWRIVEELEPTTVTLHPEILEEIVRDLKPSTPTAKKFLVNQVLANEKKSIDDLGKIIPLQKICFENFHFSDLEDYRPLIEAYDLSVCYDVGHAYIRTPTFLTAKKFFETWKNRVRNIHLHNVVVVDTLYPINKFSDHQSITSDGLIDIEFICRLFRNFDYRGAIVLEEYHNDRIQQSVAYLKKLVDGIKNETERGLLCQSQKRF